VKEEGHSSTRKSARKTEKLPKLLIVEDSGENLRLFCTILRNAGYRITSAANGKEALQKLRKAKPDLILSDILMPVMDGFRLLQECKADPDLSDIRFIFLTGAFTDAKDEEFGLEMGADTFLRKPIEPDTLTRIVSEVLARKSRSKKAAGKTKEVKDKPDHGLYNAALMQKLERKMDALEQEIADRKKAEAALVKSEEQYRLLFETMDQGVMCWSEGRVISANPAAARILGLEIDDIVGRTVDDPVWKGFHEDGSDFSPDDYPVNVAEKTGKPITDITAGFFRGVDNKIHWIRVSAIPLFQPGEDRPRQVYTTFDDITDRFFAFKALQESESRMSAILENTQDAMWSLDSDFHLIAANNSARKFYQQVYGATITEGMDIRAAMPRENRDFWNIVGQRVLSGEKVSLEKTYELVDGPVHYEFSLSPIYSASGRAFGAVCSARDITERKKAEQQINESEKRHRMVLENVSESIYVIQDGRIKFCKSGVSAITGYSGEEILNKSHEDLIHPDDIKSVMDSHFRRMSGEQVPSKQVYRAIDKNGETRWVEAYINTIEWEGRTAALVVQSDITERRQMEASLKKASRLYKMLFLCNAAMVHASSETELLQDICRIMTETGGYRIAWTGYAEDDENKAIRPVAVSGADINKLATAGITWSGGELGNGPAGRAIRTGKTVVVQDISLDPAYKPWLNMVEEAGIRSTISLPLKYRDSVFGSVNIYSDRINAFEEDDFALLDELAEDLAYGISALRERAQLKEAESALRKSEELFRKAVQSTTDIVWDWDIEAGIVTWFGDVDAMLGYQHDEFPRTLEAWENALFPDDHGRVIDALNRHAETGEPYNVEYRIRRKDGSLRNWIDRGLVIYDENGAITHSVGACVDITEHRQSEARSRVRRELALKLAGRIDMETALNYCLNAAIEISEFDTGVIYLLDEKSGDFKAACYHGGSEFLKERYTILKADSPDAKLIRKGSPIYAKAEDFVPPFDEQLKPEGFTFDATIPVVFQGRAIASLGIFSHAQDNMPLVIRDSLEAIASDIGIVIDRLSSRQALQASEERYRFISENTADVIWMLDKYLNYTFISPSITRLNGFTVEEAMSRGITERMTPDSLEKIAKALENGSIPTLDGSPGQKRWFIVEMETYHKNGSTIWMETSMALITDASGEIIGMLGTSRDISARRQAEQALRKSEEKYRLVVENAHEAIFITQDGFIKFANQNTSNMMLLKAEELLSTHFADFIYQDDKEYIIDRHQRRLKGETIGEVAEFRVIRGDGQVRWVELRAVLIEWEGQPAALNFITDITERRQSEERGKIRRDLALSLLGINDIETAAGLCLDAAIKIAGFDSGVVYLKNQETGDFRAICYRNITPALVEKLSFLSADTIWARLLMKGNPVYTKSDEFTQPFDEELRPEGMTFNATIPVKHGERVLASLGVYSHSLSSMPDLIRNSLEAISADIGIVIERIGTRRELLRSEERYNVIAENTSDVIWSADKYLQYTYFSPSVFKQRGFTPKEMLQFKMEQVITASSLDPVVNGVAEAITRFERDPAGGPVTYTGDMEVFCKDGSTKWTETSFTVIGDEQGKFNGVTGISRDTTQRRLAEKALIESETKYRSLIETSSSGVAVADETGILTMVNDRLCQIYGFSRDEVVGRQFFDFVHPDDRDRIMNDFLGAVETARTLPAIEFRGRRKDGSNIWLFTNPSALVIEGRLAGFSVIIQDITSLKQAEYALKESELRYRSLFHYNPAMTFALDRQGNFTSVNAAAVNISGYSEEEALKMNFIHVIPPEYTETVIQHNAGSLNGEPQSYEAAFIAKDGRKIDIQITGIPIIIDGNVTGVYGIAEDITGRKKAAEDLKMALEKASSTLDGTIEAIAMMSELRDPYTAGHQRMVSQLAVAIAEELGLEQNRIQDLTVAGLLHDVGKVYVPSEILSKPGKLTSLELGLAKAHAEASYNIVRSIKFSGPIAHIVWQHHERIDGSGYPQGLVGDQIILEARILAVADVVEAMVSHRPYRPAMGLDKALDEITRNRAVLYDAQAVDACLSLFNEKGFKFRD
jgi:PAS domain S-box-containing protein/putative nucleotidyltransferase with HDIG domain